MIAGALTCADVYVSIIPIDDATHLERQGVIVGNQNPLFLSSFYVILDVSHYEK
jgi:hypothetical protein